MRHTFHLKTLAVAVATLSVASVASAAGLDRSGQDITAFLQDGTYAEAVYTYIDADVTGKDTSGNKIDDIAESYDFFRYGVKTDINDTFSVGILYDEPFGAAADYTGNNNFVGAPTDAVNNIIASRLGGLGVNNVEELKGLVEGTQNQLTAAETRLNAVREQVRQAQAAVNQNPALEPALRPQINAGLAGIAAGETQLAEGQAQLNQLEQLEGFADGRLANDEGTNVEVRSESITGILGAKFGQNKEFQVYGGPVVQRIKADVSLRGSAYSAATGYTAHISPDTDYGYIAGISYSKPEIALKAALTYRSEIDHSSNIDEIYPVVAALGGEANQGNTLDITTPKSVNFDFQTGINPTTLATAKVRWVPWSDFAITPSSYNGVSQALAASPFGAGIPAEGLDLVSYDDDQWQVELGLAKRLAPALAVSGTVGWDSGAGNPVTSLGPTEGYYSAGLGAKYNVTENWAISAGGKYLWLGDAEGQIPSKTIVSDFDSNDGFVLGMKVSYQAQ